MSETLASRYEYREFFELKACDVIMYDVTWCGGPSEAKRISDMAETYMIPDFSAHLRWPAAVHLLRTPGRGAP